MKMLLQLAQRWTLSSIPLAKMVVLPPVPPHSPSTAVSTCCCSQLSYLTHAQACRQPPPTMPLKPHPHCPPPSLLFPVLLQGHVLCTGGGQGAGVDGRAHQPRAPEGAHSWHTEGSHSSRSWQPDPPPVHDAHGHGHLEGHVFGGAAGRNPHAEAGPHCTLEPS